MEVGFDAVGIAEFVQAPVGGLHLGWIQVPPPGSRGAAQAPMTERKSVSKRTSKSPRRRRLARLRLIRTRSGSQHHARIGAPPQDRVAAVEPGKGAARIGGQQPAGRVRRRGEQAVGVAHRLVERREASGSVSQGIIVRLVIGIAAETMFRRADLVEGHHVVDVEADADALADGVVVMARHQRRTLVPLGRRSDRGSRRRGKPLPAPRRAAGWRRRELRRRAQQDVDVAAALAGFAGRPSN